MKKRVTTILLVLAFLIGLSLLLYPTISDRWNSMRQSRAISSYTEVVANLERDRYEKIWNDARTYNTNLVQRENHYILTEQQKAEYNALLNVEGNGIMGYIEIPAIGVTLPLYHGTEESVLQIATGHLEWTSLPVGGEGTHCVISGHRGLPSSRLFTDLDQLTEGDVFMIRVLDEILTYEVDQILIVEPHVTDSLLIEEGKDLFTLVTCTPYGINSHRLLVRGHRIANQEEAKIIRATADAVQIDPLVVAPFVAAPILLMLLIYLLIPKRREKRRKGT